MDQLLLQKIYAAFNARDIETVLSAMHSNVDWPNGWEGGHVYGHNGVREYWTRQWEVLDPHVEPVAFHVIDANRVAVDVHSVIHDRKGNLLADHMVQHIYSFEDGLIRSMEIRAFGDELDAVS